MKRLEVAIIGAGPFGLSLASFLVQSGISHEVFGRPMSFWANIAAAAPRRYLKSFCFGTNIPSPLPATHFTDWSRARGLETFEPCSIADFARYGEWLQRHCIPTSNDRTIVGLSPCGEDGGFRLLTDGDEEIFAAKVVVATGLSMFEYVPPVFKTLPSEAVTHTNAVRTFASFKGRTIAVVGHGQSALEAAALLHEAGAKAELIVRDPKVKWMSRLASSRTMMQRLRSPISGLGSGPKAWVLTNFPSLCHHIPDRVRTGIVRRHLPPEGAWWLRDRVEAVVETHVSTSVVDARTKGEQVELRLAGPEGATQLRRYDHVVAGTGFRVDLGRLGFVDTILQRAIARIGGSPRLDRAFQSSVRGLYFVGPTSAMSFGPLMRFVVGATYTSSAVHAHLSRELAVRA